MSSAATCKQAQVRHQASCTSTPYRLPAAHQRIHGNNYPSQYDIHSRTNTAICCVRARKCMPEPMIASTPTTSTSAQPRQGTKISSTPATSTTTKTRLHMRKVPSSDGGPKLRAVVELFGRFGRPYSESINRAPGLETSETSATDS